MATTTTVTEKEVTTFKNSLSFGTVTIIVVVAIIVTVVVSSSTIATIDDFIEAATTVNESNSFPVLVITVTIASVTVVA